MAKVQVLNVAVLDNPSSFGNPFQFEITFECMEDLPEGERCVHNTRAFIRWQFSQCMCRGSLETVFRKKKISIVPFWVIIKSIICTLFTIVYHHIYRISHFQVVENWRWRVLARPTPQHWLVWGGSFEFISRRWLVYQPDVTSHIGAFSHTISVLTLTMPSQKTRKLFNLQISLRCSFCNWEYLDS